MRAVKVATNLFPLKLVWTRISFSKVTATFFIIAVVHCIVQVSLQGFAFSINDSALQLLQSIVSEGSINGSLATGVTVYDNSSLSVCNGVPSPSTCTVIWTAKGLSSLVPVATIPETVSDGYDNVAPVPASSSIPSVSDLGFHTGGVESVTPVDVHLVQTPAAPAAAAPTNVVVKFVAPDGQVIGETTQPPQSADAHGPIRRGIDATLTRQVNSKGGFVGVLVQDPDLENGKFLATPNCIASMQVPIESLRNTKRVDLTFIFFQVWVLGMSIVALLNESVPHTIAAVLTHVLATAWSGYQLHMTAAFRAEVTELIVNGPCKANLLPEYWDPRQDAEISVVALNAAVLVCNLVLSYMLVKSFGWQTFKRIGASLIINRVYHLVLAFSITVQLSLFFVGASLILWLDQLYNGQVASYIDNRTVYVAIYLVALGLLIPWLTIGWFAVRRESRLWMHVFIVMAVVMISGWALMFVSSAFVWTLQMWDFFAGITGMTAVLLLTALVLGIICRINFGKGLLRYLNNSIPDDEPDFVPADVKDNESFYTNEKAIEFPSRDNSSPVPTFSEAFGRGDEARSALERLAMRPAPGISMHARSDSVSAAEPAYLAPTATRGVYLSPNATGAQGLSPASDRSLELARVDSGSSTYSTSSERKEHRSSPSDASSKTMGKRWLIE